MKNNAKNSNFIKSYNRSLILRNILAEPLSRASLAQKIGLTRAAITMIIDDLIKAGIVNEIGKSETSYGRKPVLLDINPDSSFAFGIDINRICCCIGLVDIKGNVREKIEILHGIFNSVDETLNHISGIINEMIKKCNIKFDNVQGIGVSSPGPLDVFNGIILNPPNFNIWHNINIYEKLKKLLPFNVYLENSANALALYEKNYGKAANFASFILIAVTTGVGAGIVINQQLYRGAGGFGSEIGHTCIDLNGSQCNCGNRGCLELYTSIPAIVKYGSIKGIYASSWKEIVDRAESGDNDCINLIGIEAKYLSIGITNLLNILETEAVVLSGDISYKPNILASMIKNIISKTAITRNLRDVPVFGSNVSSDLNVVSAASIVFDRYLNASMQ